MATNDEKPMSAFQKRIAEIQKKEKEQDLQKYERQLIEKEKQLTKRENEINKKIKEMETAQPGIKIEPLQIERRKSTTQIPQPQPQTNVSNSQPNFSSENLDKKIPSFSFPNTPLMLFLVI